MAAQLPDDRYGQRRQAKKEGTTTIMNGTAGFAAGQTGIAIRFSTPMPDTAYSIVVQATNTAGYSGTDRATYLNPSHKTVNGLEV